MKHFVLFLAVTLCAVSLSAQENDIEIFEKKDGNKNIVMARNIGKVPYLVTLKINAEGMIVSPGLEAEGVVPPGYMKELATLTPQPGVGWSYGYDVSFIQYMGQPETTQNNLPTADSDQASSSAVEVPIPATSINLSTAPIIVYTREGCGRCSFVKKEMNKNQIDFEEVDINSGSAEADNMWKLLRESGFKGNTVTMPVVKINGELHYNIKDLAGFIEEIKK